MLVVMKKISFISALATYLFAAATTFAQITITPPRTTGNQQIGYSDIGAFINAALRLAFVAALVIVLAMMIWGAIQWIMSGGEKEAVGEARQRIIHALIGLAILAVAFAIVNLAGTFLGINILGTLPIPSPANPTPGFAP